MQWIPWIEVECSVGNEGRYSGWRLNEEDKMKSVRMQVSQCSLIECSGCYAAWPKASRLNAVDYMQHGSNHTD